MKIQARVCLIKQVHSDWHRLVNIFFSFQGCKNPNERVSNLPIPASRVMYFTQLAYQEWAEVDRLVRNQILCQTSLEIDKILFLDLCTTCGTNKGSPIDHEDDNKKTRILEKFKEPNVMKARWRLKHQMKRFFDGFISAWVLLYYRNESITMKYGQTTHKLILNCSSSLIAA